MWVSGQREGLVGGLKGVVVEAICLRLKGVGRWLQVKKVGDSVSLRAAGGATFMVALQAFLRASGLRSGLVDLAQQVTTSPMSSPDSQREGSPLPKAR